MFPPISMLWTPRKYLYEENKLFLNWKQRETLKLKICSKHYYLNSFPREKGIYFPSKKVLDQRFLTVQANWTSFPGESFLSFIRQKKKKTWLRTAKTAKKNQVCEKLRTWSLHNPHCKRSIIYSLPSTYSTYQYLLHTASWCCFLYELPDRPFSKFQSLKISWLPFQNSAVNGFCCQNIVKRFGRNARGRRKEEAIAATQLQVVKNSLDGQTPRTATIWPVYVRII